MYLAQARPNTYSAGSSGGAGGDLDATVLQLFDEILVPECLRRVIEVPQQLIALTICTAIVEQQLVAKELSLHCGLGEGAWPVSHMTSLHESLPSHVIQFQVT